VIDRVAPFATLGGGRFVTDFDYDVAVVGGCGHVGLPLALAFASRNLNIRIYDVNATAVAMVNAGQMPFEEPGAAEVLHRVIGTRLVATADPSVLAGAAHVVFVVGTPIDEHLNPDPLAVSEAVLGVAAHLRAGQLVILRSTLFPGSTAKVEERLAAAGVPVDVAFCPERIAEGKAMTELFELPQIVAARTEAVTERAAALFGHLTDQTVPVSPEEAELAKLFTNSYRYLKFAVANQLYKIANDHGLDYERIRAAITYNYPRAADLPKAGFAAGPCLLKDTMQLAAFNNNDFVLGHASMMVNEGLPLYVVERMATRWDLAATRVGILGMAFKGESDDVRSSLSYKLRRILRFRAASVLCTDPYVKDDQLVGLDEILAESDVLVIGAPHRVYAELRTDMPVVDIWGVHGAGVRV
jgi:UDP-N-acetyl-D-mannosaminuronic acid dehydrogenase